MSPTFTSLIMAFNTIGLILSTILLIQSNRGLWVACFLINLACLILMISI